MSIPLNRLGQAAGTAAAVGGAIFVAVQINHPPMELATITTTDWVVRSTAKTVMAGLALAGITGMYLVQRRRVGMLGLVGYVSLAIGYLMMFGTEFVAGFVLPTVAKTSPQYAEDVIVTAFGGKPVEDIGAMSVVLQATGAFYVLGGLIFGIAIVRAGVLSRSAAALLAIGNTATLSLVALPDSFNRPMAVPTGIALIGLGISLWRHQSAAQHEPAVVGARAAHPVSVQ